MKHGGVGTSGLLTLRDAQTMTTDRHAQVGWPPSRPTGTGSGAAPRRHAARWPAGPRSPARASSWHVIPAAAGAVYREKGEAHAAVAPPACEGTIGGRQERDLRLSALCPIRVQKGLPQARFRWSGPGGATPSGAVSAGSNPVGGTRSNMQPDMLIAALPTDLHLHARPSASCSISPLVPMSWPPMQLIARPRSKLRPEGRSCVQHRSRTLA